MKSNGIENAAPNGDALKAALPEYEFLELTPKGRAALSALRHGLIETGPEGVQIDSFNLFWEEIKPLLSEERIDKLDNSKHVFRYRAKDEPCGARDNARYYGGLVLTSVSSFFVFYILSAFLKAGGLRCFLFGLLLYAALAFLAIHIKSAFTGLCQEKKPRL